MGDGGRDAQESTKSGDGSTLTGGEWHVVAGPGRRVEGIGIGYSNQTPHAALRELVEVREPIGPVGGAAAWSSDVRRSASKN